MNGSTSASEPVHRPRRVTVIGGGITGLAAAHRIQELDPSGEVTLLEASDRLGGVLQTVRRDAFLMERSADNFITGVPWAVDLCRRIGFADHLISTNQAHRGALVVRGRRLLGVPEGFLLMQPGRAWPILSSPILSPLGKVRLLAEYFVRRREDLGDESVASFARRRLGGECFERLVQPLVGGIYTADPEKLSLAATLPRFAEMERRHGGLIRASRVARDAADVEQDRGARYSMFVAPREGMSSLIDALAARLPAKAVHLNAKVERIERINGGWTIFLAGTRPRTSDAVILAVPAFRAAEIVKSLDPELAAELLRIEHAGASVVTAAYRREQIHRPLDAFGFVVPAIENRRILAGSFSSVKYAGRAPDGHELIRVFLGGALQPEIAELPNGDLRRTAEEELADLLHIEGPPLFADIARWPRTMPQYHLGHIELIQSLDARSETHPGLQLAGNAYHGVGIPQCIHSGEQAAETVIGKSDC